MSAHGRFLEKVRFVGMEKVYRSVLSPFGELLKGGMTALDSPWTVTEVETAGIQQV